MTPRKQYLKGRISLDQLIELSRREGVETAREMIDQREELAGRIRTLRTQIGQLLAGGDPTCCRESPVHSGSHCESYRKQEAKLRGDIRRSLLETSDPETVQTAEGE